MDSKYCCECYSTGSNLRDVSEVLKGHTRAWVLSGKYAFGEAADELSGITTPKGFNSHWNGSEGTHFVCEKCTSIASDAYEEVQLARNEFLWELEYDPTGQTQEQYGR